MSSILIKLISIVVMSCLPFLFTLNGDFVFDDSVAIIKNNDVYSESWTDCFYNDFWGTKLISKTSHKSYRPFTVLTFRLNYYMNSKHLIAFPFKVTNLILHVISSLLVLLILNVIVYNDIKVRYEKFDISYHGVLLFTVHPIHVEAVSGVVGRADILCAITYYIAFLCYSKAMKSKKFMYWFLLLSILFTLISMLCKENGITVLCFCIIFDVVNEVENFKKIKFNRNFVIRVFISIASILLFLYSRWTVMGGVSPEFKYTDNPAAFSSYHFTRIATHNYIYFLNAVLLVWPQWLCYDWSMGCVPLIHDVTDYRIIFPIFMYIYGIYVLYTLCTKSKNSMNKRVIVLSAALIVIPFLPATNIFYNVGFVIAERILYISSTGYCLMISYGLCKIIQRSKKRKIWYTFYVFLIVIYALRSWKRSYDWKNEYNLFINGYSVCPLNAKVHYNIAKVTDAKNETDIALASYKEALRLYPNYYQAMNNLGNLLKNLKEYKEAEIYLRKALETNEDAPAAWMNLGIVLASTNRFEESERAYKIALKYRKNYPNCYYNLGNLYLEIQRPQDAIKNWLKAVHWDKGHVLAWTNLLALLDNEGQLDQALSIIPKALAELPDSPTINFAVANIYGKLDRFLDSEQHFLKAIKLFDTKVQAIHYANLGVLYHRWKKYKQADTMYKNALKIDPSFKSATKNLKSLQKSFKY